MVLESLPAHEPGKREMGSRVEDGELHEAENDTDGVGGEDATECVEIHNRCVHSAGSR